MIDAEKRIFRNYTEGSLLDAAALAARMRKDKKFGKKSCMMKISVLVKMKWF